MPIGVCGIFRPPVQGGSNKLISKFLSSMILYNHPSYFKSGEINSWRLSSPPTLSNARWFYGKKKHKIGKGNMYITENGLMETKCAVLQIINNYMCHTCAKEFLDLNFNSPVSHSARHQRPAQERHKIRIASRGNVDNQTPRNTNFTH